MERDLTTGSVLKTVIYFSLPFLLSYFLQTLYGLADLFIIGQFADVASITAVALGSQVMHMLTVMLVGLAMGSTVLIGRAVGGGHKQQAALTIGNTAVLFGLLSLLLTGLLLLSVDQIVELIATPAEAVAATRRYLVICFLGIPFITAYNICSSIFRGLGDSQSPMYFIAVACAANIALDYLFMGALGLGTAGAALGTVLSQTISVALALCFLRRQSLELHLTKEHFRPQGLLMRQLLHIGVPICLQDGLIQVSFIIITIFANLRGLDDAAAVGIVEKIISILFLVPSSMLSATSVLAAQNLGAAKHDRAVRTLYYACAIAVGWGLFAVGSMYAWAEQVLALFGDNARVILLGSQYLRGYVLDAVLAGVHFCFSGYFCAYGLANISFLHNVISIFLMRIPLSYVASVYYPDTLFPMGLATTVGSFVSVVICICVFIWLQRKQRLQQS